MSVEKDMLIAHRNGQKVIRKRWPRGFLFNFLLVFYIIFVIIVLRISWGFLAHIIPSFCFTYKEAAELVLYYDGVFYDDEINHREKIKLIEKDSYGRRLYCYSVHPREYFYGAVQDFYVPTIREGEYPQVYIIIQKKTDREVYFYGEESIFFSTNELLAEIGIDELKKRNDWEQPLALKKAYAVSEETIGTVGKPLYDEADMLTNALEEALGRETEDHFLGVVYDENQNPVYVFREIEERQYINEPIVYKESYAFMLDDQNEVRNYIVLEGDLEDWLKQIKDFREQFPTETTLTN